MMDGWMDIHPTPLASGSTTDGRPARARIHPSIEPMRPISLRGYQTLVGRSVGRETDARVERETRRRRVGGVCADGWIAPRDGWMARVYGALWILVLDFSQRDSAPRESFCFYLMKRTRVTD